MEIEIKEKRENNLLERTEVDAVVSFDGATPQTQQVRELLVQKLGCNPDLMVIRKSDPKFGETKVSLLVHIYKTPDRMKKVEEAYVLKRNNLYEEPKKEEDKPKEDAAPKEEAKPEEKKEEPKPEEKKE